MILLRPFVRVLGSVWTLALALVALGISLYCLDGLVALGSARPDRLLELPSARRHTGRLLAQLEAPGHLAGLSFLCALAAIALALTILWGLFGRPRRRLAVLDDDAHTGVLAVRRRTLRQMLSAHASEPREVLAVKRMRLALRRRGLGGRLRLDAVRDPASEQAAVEAQLEQALAPIAEPFALRMSVRARLSRADRESPHVSAS